MRILHLLSQTQLTGAEAYAIQLADRQIRDGHSVWILSDQIHLPTQAVFVPLGVSKRSFVRRLQNRTFLRRFVREHKIDVIHAHSRAASWLASFSVSRLDRDQPLGIPLISSIHGRQHWHGRFKKNDVYGTKAIAVCENLKTHLEVEFGLLPRKLSLLPNGIDWTKLLQDYGSARTRDPKSSFTLGWVGRSTGPKGANLVKLAREVFPDLLTRNPHWKLKWVGCEMSEFSSEDQTLLKNLVDRFAPRIEVKGRAHPLASELATLDALIAAGRIAIEGLGLGIPVFALGEALAFGWVTEKNLELARRSNFGDVHASRFDSSEFHSPSVLGELAISPQPVTQALAEQVRGLYDLESIHTQVLEIYRGARMQRLYPRGIPALMYHKVVEREIESPHRIFVTAKTLRAQFEIIRDTGRTPITFEHYLALSQETPGILAPLKPIFITFDDGYKNNLELALPLLKEFDFKATLYALASDDHRENDWDRSPTEPMLPLLNRQEKRSWVDAGMALGSHALTHRDLRLLPPPEAAHEITESKRVLEQITGQPIISFAYPFGCLSEEIKKTVQQAGYRFGISTDHGGLHLEDDRFEIFRANVFPEDLGLAFRKKLSTLYRRYFKLRRGK